MIGIQGNFHKMPIQITPNILQPSEQEEIIEDQNIENIENIEGQDYITEVLNISKVKEGFYIGDKIAAISIEVVVQFKLTHMINASGNQIINQWETIGMKYLTLNGPSRQIKYYLTQMMKSRTKFYILLKILLSMEKDF